jgi:hypothetical protein
VAFGAVELIAYEIQNTDTDEKKGWIDANGTVSCHINSTLHFEPFAIDRDARTQCIQASATDRLTQITSV